MEQEKLISRYPALFCAIGMAISWLALAAQFYLILANRTASIPETITRFFSYFTILTNILVAVSFTLLFRRPRSRPWAFFLRPGTLTAIAVYISIVSIVYNLVLRALWNPQGLQLLVDELLHSVIPVMFFLFWLLYVPKNRLSFKNLGGWLIYPFIYLAGVLVRGAVSGFYPYPFLDVTAKGYVKIFINIIVLLGGFLLFSIFLLVIAKLRRKEEI
jgi:hypothetical protein